MTRREILLERPGPPVMDDATAEQVRELLAKGAVAGALFFTVDDAHATFAVLKERGVDVTDEPETRPYGIDFGIRDPLATPSASARCSTDGSSTLWVRRATSVPTLSPWNVEDDCGVGCGLGI